MRVRLFAGAADAAGANEIFVEAVSTSGELRAALSERCGPEFQRVLGRCSLMSDGTRLDGDDAPLAEDATVDVLPPFAGG